MAAASATFTVKQWSLQKRTTAAEPNATHRLTDSGDPGMDCLRGSSGDEGPFDISSSIADGVAVGSIGEPLVTTTRAPTAPLAAGINPEFTHCWVARRQAACTLPTRLSIATAVCPCACGPLRPVGAAHLVTTTLSPTQPNDTRTAPEGRPLSPS
jgi:hypothetical protein